MQGREAEQPASNGNQQRHGQKDRRAEQDPSQRPVGSAKSSSAPRDMDAAIQPLLDDSASEALKATCMPASGGSGLS